MKEYNFLLPRPKLNTYNWFAVLLVVLNSIFIFYSLNSSGESLAAVFLSRVVLVLCFMSAAIFLVFRKKPLGNYSIHLLLLALSFTAIYYFSNGRSWLGALLLLLSALYYLSFRKSWIKVSPDHIHYPGLFPSKWEWKDLNNVILKDGLLTIDRADDQLLQLEISESVDEKEFNEFCRVRLNPKISS